MSLCCDESHRETAEKKMESFVDQLPHSSFAGKPVPEFAAPGLNEGITTSGKVQYVLAGGNFRAHGHDYTGAMKVLEAIFGPRSVFREVLMGQGRALIRTGCSICPATAIHSS